MKMLKFGLVLVALALAETARAEDNNWTAGGGDDTKVSTVENWSTGVGPEDNMRFTDQAAGKTVTFDRTYTIVDYLWVGSSTSGKFFTPASEGTPEYFNPVKWEASNPAYGIYQIGSDYHFRFADQNGQNAALQIESGAYETTSDVWVGKGGGNAKVLLDGGSLKGSQFKIADAGTGILVKKDGSTVRTTGDFYIGYGSGGKGSFTQNGGTTTIGGQLYIAGGAGATGTVTNNAGVLTVNNWLCVGTTTYNASTAEFVVNGGAVSNTVANITIGSNGSGTDATGKLTVNGGDLYTVGCIYVGERYTGTRTFEMNGGHVRAEYGVLFGGNSNCKGNNRIDLNGGTLEVPKLGYNTGTATSFIRWYGGTVKMTASGTLIATNENQQVIVNKTTSVLDLNGFDTTIDAVLQKRYDTGCTLNVKNSGREFATLTLTATPSCAFVLDGNVKLVLSTGETLGTITLKSGTHNLADLPVASTGTVIVDGAILTGVSGSGSGPTISVKSGTVQVDTTGFSDVGEGKSYTLSKVVLASDASASSVTVKGTGTRYEWTTSLSTSGCTLKADKAVSVATIHWVGGNEGDVNTDANWDYGCPQTNDTVVFDRDVIITYSVTHARPEWNVLRIENGAVFTFRSTNYSDYYDDLFPHAIEGTGTIQLDRAGLESHKSASGLTIPSTIKLVLNGGSSNDSWLKGTLTQPLKIEGPVEFNNYVIVNGYVQIGSADAPVTLTGNGTVHVHGNQIGLYCADSAFTGKFISDGTALAFDGLVDTPCSDWVFSTQDIPFNVAGAYRFGSLTTYNDESAKSLSCTGLGDYVFEIGGNGAASSLGTGLVFAKSGTGTITLRKVGSGTLSYKTFGAPMIEVDGGTFLFNTADLADDTTAAISSVKVASGATLGGSVGTKTPISALAFASGARFLADATKQLSVSGDLNVSGVEVVIEEALATTLMNQTEPDTLTLLTTTGTMSGTPTGSLNVNLDGTIQWRPMVEDKVLVFRRTTPISGLYLFVE